MLAMVRVQLLTGMRPGELCQLRSADIDTSDASGVWLFRPRRHKTQHHGHDRVVIIGPRAQAILRPYLDAGEEYVFSPTAAERFAACGSSCEPQVTADAERGRPEAEANPKRPKRQRYDETSFRNAAYRACDQAFPPTGSLARRPKESTQAWLARLTSDEKGALAKWRRERRWHPNRLRRTAATNICKEYGIEAARAILGHSRLATTEVYAEIDRVNGARVMTNIG